VNAGVTGQAIVELTVRRAFSSLWLASAWLHVDMR